MPAATDVLPLLRLLQRMGNLRIALHQLEESVYIDGSETLRKGDVIVRRELLIAQHDHAVLETVRIRSHPGCVRRYPLFVRLLLR